MSKFCACQFQGSQPCQRRAAAGGAEKGCLPAPPRAPLAGSRPNPRVGRHAGASPLYLAESAAWRAPAPHSSRRSRARQGLAPHASQGCQAAPVKRRLLGTRPARLARAKVPVRGPAIIRSRWPPPALWWGGWGQKTLRQGPSRPILARVARDALACLPLRARLGWHSKRRGGAGGGEAGRGMLGRRAGPLQSRGPVLGGGAAAACAAACRVRTCCATQRQARPVHSAPAAVAPPRILSLSTWGMPGSSALGSLAGNRDCLRHPRLALPGIITVGLAQPACPRQPEARCQTLALRHGTGELNGIFHEMTRVSHSNIKAMF